AADLGFGADALRDREGALQERIERRADGTDFTRDVPGLFDLAEDLRFTDNHGVERGSDAEEMANGLALAQSIEVRRDRVGGDVEVLVQEIECSCRFGAVGAFDDREKLDAIAGGENESFADAGLASERARGVGETRDGDSETLADVERSGGVVHADE